MAQELKHVGRVIATKKKCLVAYRTLPGDAYSCLIVPTENMPDIYHDAIINLVESSAGQEAYEFAEALDRTQFPDGSRMLPWLHVNNRLLKAPTDAIEMTPVPGAGILLSELNQIIAEQRGVAVDDLAINEGVNDKPKKPTVAPVNELAATPTAKVVEEKVESTVALTPEGQAKEYRSKADKLAKEAAQYRRMAEELVPTKKKIL
jgi:hypothetical protein